VCSAAFRGPFSALAATASGDWLRHPALVPARRYEARPLSRAASPPSAFRGPFSALAATASGDRLRHPALVPARQSDTRLLSRAASSLPAPRAFLIPYLDGWEFFHPRPRRLSRPHGFGSLATPYGCRLRTMPTYLPWSPPLGLLGPWVTHISHQGYLSYPRFRLSSLCQLHRSLGSRHRSYLGPSPKVTESSHLNPIHSNRYSDLTASPRRRRCEFI